MNPFDNQAIQKNSWAFQSLIEQLREWTPTRPPRNVSASGNVNPLDDVVRVDTTSAAVTLNLESAVGCPGRQHTFKKIDASGNAMTIDGFGSETIDGSATISTSTQYVSFTLKSNGSGWDVV